jgi:hypothetical protein
MHSLKGWTYGAELEYGDLNRHATLPKGCGWDVRDFTMVNSNGIAVDPKGVGYGYGGEVNTAPVGSPNDLAAHVGEIYETLRKQGPAPAVNYRSNLHIHVRVPGLRDDLPALKRLQRAIHGDLKSVLDEHLRPLPRPTAAEYPTSEEFEGALVRWKRRRKSHGTFLTPQRLERQYAAQTVDEFLAAEVPRTAAGEPAWVLQPRCAVNIRQLRETDTIEFRHFSLTNDLIRIASHVLWVKDFMRMALTTETPSAERLWFRAEYEPSEFPRYVHWMEQRYRRTVRDGTVPADEVAKNIREILDEDSRRVHRQR